MKEDILSHLNMSSDTSNVVPAASFVAAETIPVAVAKASAVLVREDRTVPISGFTKAMVKSMTEAMVSFVLYTSKLPKTLLEALYWLSSPSSLSLSVCWDEWDKADFVMQVKHTL